MKKILCLLGAVCFLVAALADGNGQDSHFSPVQVMPGGGQNTIAAHGVFNTDDSGVTFNISKPSTVNLLITPHFICNPNTYRYQISLSLINTSSPEAGVPQPYPNDRAGCFVSSVAIDPGSIQQPELHNGKVSTSFKVSILTSGDTNCGNLGTEYAHGLQVEYTLYCVLKNGDKPLHS